MLDVIIRQILMGVKRAMLILGLFMMLFDYGYSLVCAVWIIVISIYESDSFKEQP